MIFWLFFFSRFFASLKEYSRSRIHSCLCWSLKSRVNSGIFLNSFAVQPFFDNAELDCWRPRNDSLFASRFSRRWIVFRNCWRVSLLFWIFDSAEGPGVSSITGDIFSTEDLGRGDTSLSDNLEDSTIGTLR